MQGSEPRWVDTLGALLELAHQLTGAGRRLQGPQLLSKIWGL